MQTESDVTLNTPEGHIDPRHSFEQTADERAAIPDDQVRSSNIEAYGCVLKVTGSAPDMAQLEAPCREQLPRMDHALFKKLVLYVLAFSYAHIRFLAASKPPKPVPELAVRLGSRHALFQSICVTLAKAGLIEEVKLGQLGGANSYKTMTHDVQLMALWIRESWSTIEGKVPITLVDLDDAETMAAEFMLALGEREQQPVRAAEAAVERDRAFTLFIRAYYELRRAAQYIRYYEGDADRFVPVIYVRKRGAADAGDDELVDIQDTTPEGVSLPASDPSRAIGMPNSNPLSDK